MAKKEGIVISPVPDIIVEEGNQIRRLKFAGI
jgi:hypothetical protein